MEGAKKRNKKGRAMGGTVMSIRKGIVEKGREMEAEKREYWKEE